MVESFRSAKALFADHRSESTICFDTAEISHSQLLKLSRNTKPQQTDYSRQSSTRKCSVLRSRTRAMDLTLLNSIISPALRRRSAPIRPRQHLGGAIAVGNNQRTT